MADHVREQVTVAVVSAVTGLTTTGARLFRDRDTDAQPLQANEVPGLTVEDDGDPAELISIDTSGILERDLRLRITAHVKAASYSTTLNKIFKEIEIALAGASLAGAKYAHPSEISGRDTSAAGDTPVVRQSILYLLRYYTARGAPDVAL